VTKNACYKYTVNTSHNVHKSRNVYWVMFEIHIIEFKSMCSHRDSDGRTKNNFKTFYITLSAFAVTNTIRICRRFILWLNITFL